MGHFKSEKVCPMYGKDSEPGGTQPLIPDPDDGGKRLTVDHSRNRTGGQEKRVSHQ
jgi:hypothetical protein